MFLTCPFIRLPLATLVKDFTAAFSSSYPSCPIIAAILAPHFFDASAGSCNKIYARLLEFSILLKSVQAFLNLCC